MTSITDVLGVAAKYLYLPDPGVIELVLATVAANRLPGAGPAWLLVVGPPSSGKTEVLDALKGLSEVHFVSRFTEAGLISGSAVREDDTEATGGMLVELGESGVLVFKDLTTALGQMELLDLLREVFDGHYVRSLGTKGGRSFEWQGKAGVLGAVTQAIDTLDMGLLGPRFCFYRFPHQSAAERHMAGLFAQENVGQQAALRQELAESVATLFDDLVLPDEPYELAIKDQERLCDLADFGTLCRSPVVRASYSREVELVPEPEGTPRLIGQLKLLLLGLFAIGVEDGEAWRLLGQICVGGIHSMRWRVLEALLPPAPGGRVHDYRTSSVARRCGLPPTTTKHHLEDLVALGVAELVSDPTDPEDPEAWALSGAAGELWQRVGSLVLGDRTEQL